MRGSLPLFRFRGIRVLVHWSFLLLPAYIAFTGFSEGTTWPKILVDVGLVMIVFACVVLHEFGHALTAQRFGVGTRDITLLPIGGVASLERMPEDPKQEFWITIAGPLVNLAIAGLAFALLAVSGISILFTDLFDDITSWHSVLAFLFATNIGLFLFNLLPAFPMDGGRILRSLLSLRLSRDRATRIATGVGKVMAVCFVAYGLLNGAPFLAMIGVFIFLSAGSEAKVVRQRSQLRSLLVSGAMRKDPIHLGTNASVQDAWNAMTMVDHRVVLARGPEGYAGVVLREDLRAALAQGYGTGPIASYVKPVPGVRPEEAALPLYQRMVAEGLRALPVIESGGIIATIELRDLENALGPLAPSV